MESAQATPPAEMENPASVENGDSGRDSNHIEGKTIGDVDMKADSIEQQLEESDVKTESNGDQLTDQDEGKIEQDLKAAVLEQVPIEEEILSLRFKDLQAQEKVKELQQTPSQPPQNDILSHVHCLAQLEEQRRNYEQQLEQLRTSNVQKDNMITLIQRENAILGKEKQACRKEMEMANKEKEATVIKFAMKEKLLIDAKKEKEAVEKQLAEAKKEVKNVSTRFLAVSEEKSRMTYIIDEKVGGNTLLLL